MAKNRREALKQGFALLGAAVGIGVARKSLAASPDAPSDARQSIGTPRDACQAFPSSTVRASIDGSEMLTLSP